MKHMTRFVIVLCLAFFASAALFSDPAFAIASWARKYDVSCSVCHYPVVPRLNATGHKFRRAGYRMDDEFNKTADWTKAGNYVAMRARARYEYEDPEGGDTTSQFNFHDATFFFAGPIAKNFSGFVELEREAADDLVAVVHVGGVFGEPDRYWSFRIGRGTVELDGYAHLRNLSFRVGRMPILYTPYLLWPVKKDRASGFLMPQVGYSARRGAVIKCAVTARVG